MMPADWWEEIFFFRTSRAFWTSLLVPKHVLTVVTASVKAGRYQEGRLLHCYANNTSINWQYLKKKKI